MIEFLFLDLDDTILDFHKAERIAISKTIRQFGVEPTEEVLGRYHTINKHQWELLERGEEFCRCRHKRTGYEMDILTSNLLRQQDGDWLVNDCTDYRLPLQPGDEISVVAKTSRGYQCKHKGVSGWYEGRLE